MKIKKVILLTLSFLLSVSTAGLKAETSASAVEGKKQTLFNSSSHETEPYRIPAIATLSNGEVIAIADQRPCGADVGNGEVDIYAKISSDGGATWNPSSEDPSTETNSANYLRIADGGTGTSKGYGDAAVAADPNSGKVVVMCVGGGSTIFANATTSTTDYLCIRNYSEDYGRTWKQTEVTSYFKGDNNVFGADVASMFFGSGKLAVSKKIEGRIYGALLVRQGKTKLFGSYIAYETKNYVVYSEDWGASWNLLGDGACCSGGDEPKVEELPNGDILLSSRTEGGRYFNVFNFADIENDKTSGSWGTATSVSFAGSNSTNGEILLYQGVTKVGETSGTKYNVMLQSLPTGSSRSNVSVYYKAYDTSKSTWSVSDFTSGWTKGIEVDDGASAYSTMDILPNGEIGFLYEDNYDTSKADGDYSDIVFVPLTVEEITGGAYTYEAETPVVETVATPVISPAGGEVEAGTTVSLTCATSGAVIYYSLDGSAPATVYSAPIALTEAVTVRAIAKKDGYNNSAEATATFTIKEEQVVETVSTPVISPESGEITAETEITITCATEGATIHYTTDGTVPTTSSAVYAGAFTLSEDATVNAIAVKEGWNNSEVAGAEFTVKQNESNEDVNAWTVTTTRGVSNGKLYYYAIFSANKPFTLPYGIRAYYVLSANSSSVAITSIPSSKTIPAYQGVILRSVFSAKTFEVTATDDESNLADLSRNILVSTADAEKTVLDTESIYCMSNESNVWKFRKVDSGTIVPENSAYIDLTETTITSLSLSFGDDPEVSGIEDVEMIENAPVEYYNLQGVKVENPEKGIYIKRQGGKTTKVVL